MKSRLKFFITQFSPVMRGIDVSAAFALIILLACSPNSQAQTFFGAGTEALGLAGRAANIPLDAHYLNPAGLAFSSESNAGVAFQLGAPTLSTPSNAYNAVITDNTPDKFAAGGFGYLYRRTSYPDHTIIDQDFSLDVAVKIVPTISLGVQTHSLSRQNSGGLSFTKYNATFGILVLPKPFLAFSVDFYDMINDPDLQLIPVTAIGTHIIIMDILRFRIDVTQPQKLNPQNTGSLNAGIEIDSGSGFLFRLGGDWDTYNVKTYWSAGLSWEGPRLSVAYAFLNDVTIPGDTTQTFQAWLNF